MKIDINKINTTPKGLPFGLSFFGEPTQEIKDWLNYHKLETTNIGKYTNISVDKIDINDLFNDIEQFNYADGFSPNLSKNLHLGHLSNLVLAKALQSLNISKNWIAILGDTVGGDVDKDESLLKYNQYCNKFGYKVDDIYFASKQMLSNNIMVDGEGEFVGTKVFNIGDEKVVGIKSDGSTSYFYQDVALAQKLNSKTLYLTGFEQNNHFNLLSKLYPTTSHIGLGLVTIDGKKMSTSEGNVLLLQDIVDLLLPKFNDDINLVYNVLAGFILKTNPSQTKNISLKEIDNVKLSPGLYLSYTMASMMSAGCYIDKVEIKNSLKFKYLMSKVALQPNYLVTELVELAKEMNHLYNVKGFKIKDNIENTKTMSYLLSNLWWGMDKLGLLFVNKV